MKSHVLIVVLAALGAAGCGKAKETTARADPPHGPTPTFNKDIAPIVFDYCSSCHRPGQASPFTLITYDDVKKRADKIVDAVKDRHMPPWLPERGYGDFVGERRMRDDQIEMITRWAKEGAPEGAASDLPKAPTWKEGWQLGQPDLVVTMPHPYTLQPGEEDIFRNFVLPVALPAGRFVRAVEFRPGAAPIIHHAVISIDRTRASRRRDGADGQAGYDGMVTQGAQSPDGHFLGWTPGRGPILAPTDMPWRLEQGSDLVVQLHLLPQKKPETVQVSVGLFFTDTPPVHTPVMIKLCSKAIDIPAGEHAYAITDKYVLPVDVDVLSVYPHAHYLGKEMQAAATLPDGTTKPLLRIEDWDFHWQQDYRYVAPVALPRGTTVTMKYTYDNSADNDHNPHNPPRPVVYGPNSSDEMGNLWLQVLPHSSADAGVLIRDFAAREAIANVAGAEMAVRRAPTDAKNQAFLGSSYADVGRIDDAIPHLEEALRLDPKSANAQNYLGGAMLTKQRVPEAIAHLRQAAALDPRDERLHFNLGNALNVAGQPEEAAREFQRAIDVNPEFAEAHDNLGIFLLSRNQLAAANAELKRAAALAPNSPEIQNDLGAALASVGKTAEALEHVKRAIELRPDYAPAQQNLALIQRRPH